MHPDCETAVCELPKVFVPWVLSFGIQKCNFYIALKALKKNLSTDVWKPQLLSFGGMLFLIAFVDLLVIILWLILLFYTLREDDVNLWFTKNVLVFSRSLFGTFPNRLSYRTEPSTLLIELYHIVFLCTSFVRKEIFVRDHFIAEQRLRLCQNATG